MDMTQAEMVTEINTFLSMISSSAWFTASDNFVTLKAAGNLVYNCDCDGNVFVINFMKLLEKRRFEFESKITDDFRAVCNKLAI